MSLVPSPPAIPELVSICGRDPAAVERRRRRFGWREAVADWHEQVADPRVELFDNCGPNALHAAPTIEAARNGKHVFCEKPLGVTADEAHRIWSEAEAAGVVHMCGFNYRFVPAIRLAREIIEAGDLGEIYHFRSRFLNGSALKIGEEGVDPWRFDRLQSGSGAVGDIGAHHIDLARYLMGEPVSVLAMTRTIPREEGAHKIDVDDSFAALLELEGGATATVEASRIAGGHQNENSFEVEGSKGCVSFEILDFNVLRIAHGNGVTRLTVTEPEHPFMDLWWETPMPIGWGSTFVHEFHHLLSAIAGWNDVAPHGATFRDGYRVAEVCDALLRAGETGQRETITYREAAHMA
jgi:predicted dehydrogenase